MSERGNELHAVADRQIVQLLDLLSTLDADTSRRPCPGRERLGDGTVAATARHSAENYGRIAAFLTANQQARGAHIPRERGGHGPSAGPHDGPYTADSTDLAAVARELSNTRDAIGQVAALTDRELDAIPPEGTFRFCDGRRTLEQILVSLLRHQAHQLDALNAAVSEDGQTVPR